MLVPFFILFLALLMINVLMIYWCWNPTHNTFYNSCANMTFFISVFVSMFPQRSSENRSIPCRTPEENPDQCSVHEAPCWWPVSYWICVTTQRGDAVWNILTSVQSVKEQAVIFTLLVLPSYTSVCCSWRSQPFYMFLNNGQTVAICVSAWPDLSFSHWTYFSHTIWLPKF